MIENGVFCPTHLNWCFPTLRFRTGIVPISETSFFFNNIRFTKFRKKKQCVFFFLQHFLYIISLLFVHTISSQCEAYTNPIPRPLQTNHCNSNHRFNPVLSLHTLPIVVHCLASIPLFLINIHQTLINHHPAV